MVIWTWIVSQVNASADVDVANTWGASFSPRCCAPTVASSLPISTYMDWVIHPTPQGMRPPRPNRVSSLGEPRCAVSDVAQYSKDSAAIKLGGCNSAPTS
jgi:hypothetical protein